MSRICSFQPIFDEYCTLLILGSCPSIRSLEKGQYYGHPQNRFWRVISALLGESLPVSYEERKAMLLRHRVALWDVAGSCEREGSLDSSVKNVQPNDIPGLLAKCPRITAVAFNGTLSTRLYFFHFPKQEGMTYIQLPSTSPIPRPGMAAYEDVLCAWKEALSSCIGK